MVKLISKIRSFRFDYLSHVNEYYQSYFIYYSIYKNHRNTSSCMWVSILADWGSVNHVIFAFDCDKNDATVRLLHCNSLWLLIAIQCILCPVAAN